MDSKLCYFLTAFITLVYSKSLTIIVDTTVSMQEEINVIRRNIGPVADFTKNLTDFENYIIVPFNDPDVGPPIISTNPADFVEILGSLSVSGGHDCPEDALAGIQKGLEVSQPESFIYVFTDAYAKDDRKFRNIESLCKSSRSQVVIFLSGSCSGAVSRQQGIVDIYYDIARACSGAFFRFDSVNLRKAFNYMKEIVAADWTDVINHEPFNGYKQFSFTVDKFTSDVLVAVSGDYAALQILDTEGTSPRIQKIVDTRQSLVVRVANAKPGVYQTSVRCEGATSLTFYKKNQVPFKFGFSTRRPSSLKETSVRPIPGWINYMLIVLPPTYNIQITSVILQMADGKETETLDLMESKTRKGYYVASVASLYMEPGRTFRCVIQGRDTTTYEEITAATKIVAVQRQVQEPKWTKPVVEMIEFEENPIDFGINVTIACRVNGYPKPEISWENSVDSSEEVLVEIPSTFISYGTVNVTANSTITCKARNSEGEEEQHFDLFVHRPLTFDVIQKPKDETFEYGYEGRLYCEVDAYPEAEVQWYHNDSSVSFNYNIEVFADQNTLLIKNMTLDEVGTYKCEAKNSVKTESFEAVVSISGLDPPQVDVEKTEVILKPGDFTDIECRVTKGNPTPEITWKYQSDNEFDIDSSLPSEVYSDGGKLKIPAVKIEHKGTYRCLAKNIMGEDSLDVVVKIQYAPKITNTEEGTLVVTEGDLVELNCDVDAIPKAVVRWEVTQGDVIVTTDERHSTNDRNTHRFRARDKDSGNYHCVAENNIGKTEKTITVNVLVPPYIQPPQFRLMEVSIGQNVSLTCTVVVGNPVPYTKWEFIAYDSTTTVLTSGNTTVAELQLFNVTRVDEGMYLCIADNDVGNDRIRIHLKVQ